MDKNNLYGLDHNSINMYRFGLEHKALEAMHILNNLRLHLDINTNTRSREVYEKFAEFCSFDTKSQELIFEALLNPFPKNNQSPSVAKILISNDEGLLDQLESDIIWYSY